MEKIFDNREISQIASEAANILKENKNYYMIKIHGVPVISRERFFFLSYGEAKKYAYYYIKDNINTLAKQITTPVLSDKLKKLTSLDEEELDRNLKYMTTVFIQDKHIVLDKYDI